ncbi:hypothetical protein C4097_06770 [Clostridioides difficile]|uniref:hypothetical protein n=1 Tax=Clostridioides sp. ZZV15-6598 TaxID=2811501 RepID=UPI001D0FD242|nr:hypothetical protein [Clostridioides sp. ZZV15-6598]MDB3084263.1 hypothetical protein [Clostridioides difficile]
MKKRNIKINEMVQSKIKLIINHKIPCKVLKFIDIFGGKVIQIFISHVLRILISYVLVNLGINPEFKWLATIIANILIYIFNILKKDNKS